MKKIVGQLTINKKAKELQFPVSICQDEENDD